MSVPQQTAVDHQPLPEGRGRILKFCLLATGAAGLVAEYVLCTLATYILGNAVLQWTVVISLMLFAMGLGARATRRLIGNLLDKFIFAELTLTVLCGGSAVLSYSLYGSTNAIALVIYGLAMAVGFLVGLEIPLVTRINESYEELRVNIASVMEYDYFGALIGGVFFAFLALPRLGLVHTPIVLACVNLLVAALLAGRFRGSLRYRSPIALAFCLVGLVMVFLALFSQPIILYGEQRLYKDKIIYAEQSRYQKIVLTRWKGDCWLFINGNEQFSSFDEERYHEPLVHPAMSLPLPRPQVLLLGGGDGLALREVLKYEDVASVTLVDLDPAMTTLASTHPVLLDLNEGSLRDPRVKVVNRDAAAYLADTPGVFHRIIIDLPDPNSIELGRLYSVEFYRLCLRSLARGGVAVTQATSPIFSRRAFGCILKTMREAGFACVPYHNQVPTLGEWGWVLGMDAGETDEADLRKALLGLTFERVPTRFLNREALVSMLHFGKGVFDDYGRLEVNRKSHPVLTEYYRRGKWDFY